MPREVIEAINEYSGNVEHVWGREEGFQIVTSEQVITLAIDADQSCCERWGYFMTEDDLDRFIGRELRGVSVTDIERNKEKLRAELDGEMYEGGVMFVDIETDRGVLQFVAYNEHNGFYGHEARVSSKQVTHKEIL